MLMRTTIDLDPELHAEAVEHARRSRISLSQVVNQALRGTFHPVGPIERDPLTGLATLTIGRPITAAEVADALDDE